MRLYAPGVERRGPLGGGGSRQIRIRFHLSIARRRHAPKFLWCCAVDALSTQEILAIFWQRTPETKKPAID